MQLSKTSSQSFAACFTTECIRGSSLHALKISMQHATQNTNNNTHNHSSSDGENAALHGMVTEFGEQVS